MKEHYTKEIVPEIGSDGFIHLPIPFMLHGREVCPRVRLTKKEASMLSTKLQVLADSL
jgi:hypothetical protein